MRKSLILGLLSLPLLFAMSCGPKPATKLNVMTFNMRYDNPEDGENNWQYRRERVARVIESNGVDIFGAQELLVNQLNDLKGLLPEYDEVGVGREDGREAGEFNPVFYRRDRFELQDWGTFWLSETPDSAGSKGWDGACERLATWTVLRDTDGRELFFINTHLDHVGDTARREGVTLLLDRIAELSGGRPVALTGDFNADPESEVIAHVVESGQLHHTRDAAAECGGLKGSFSDFGSIPEAMRPLIDYVFVNEGFKTLSYQVLPDSLEDGYLSDHSPVLVKLQYNEQR